MITYSRVYLFINCTPPQGVFWRSRNITSCLLRSTDCICCVPIHSPPTKLPTYLTYPPTHPPAYQTIYFSLSLSLSLSPSFPPYLIMAQHFCITKKYTSEPFLNTKWLHLLNLYHPNLNPDAAADSQRYCSIWPCLHMRRTALSLSAAKSYIQSEIGILINKQEFSIVLMLSTFTFGWSSCSWGVNNHCITVIIELRI